MLWLVGGCGFLVDTSDLTGGSRPSAASGAPDASLSSDGAMAGDAGALANGDGSGQPDSASGSDGSSLPPQRRYAAAVLADKPVLYLPLGEPSGSSTVRDATGTIQPTLIGTPTFGRPGAIAGDPDTAVLFTKSGIDCGPVFNFAGLQPFTIDMWVRIPSDLALGESRYLVRKGDVLSDGGSPSDAYSVFLKNPGGGFNAFFARRSGGTTMSTDSLVSPDLAFHHLVGRVHGGLPPRVRRRQSLRQ